MRDLFGRLFRLLIVILLGPLICSCSVEAFSFLSTNLDFHSLDSFLIGLIGYMLVYGAILFGHGRLYSHVQFLMTLRHELTHSVTAMLAGRRIDELVVRNPAARSGEKTTSFVKYLDAGGGSSLISLAPYYFPLLTIPLLPLRFCVLSWAREVVDFLIGFTLAFHYASLVEELFGQRFGLGQTDITRTGVIVSYVLIGFLNLLSLATVKAVLHNDWPTVDRLTSILVRSREWYRPVLEELKRRGLLFGG
jgi:hypothetical protein